MIAHCTRKALDQPARGHFYGPETVFHVEVGKDYPVMGLGMFETLLAVLICDETEKPNWLPLGLFDIEVTAMPADWEFALYDGVAASGGDASNRWVARWGYPELVRNELHSDELIERDPQALQVFFEEFQKRSLEMRG